jgi:hypothetical protein
MIKVLLAPPFITTGRLEMTMVERANPNFFPRRRNHQSTDALERMPITNDSAFGSAIAKPMPALLAADARAFIGDVAQPDDLR